MTGEEIQLLVLRGLMSQLPPAERDKAEACVQQLQQMISEHGDPGKLALAIVAMGFAVLEGK